MSKREYRDFIWDIWREINHIEAFTQGVTYEALLEDDKTLYAIVRCFEILGEATKHIPEEVRQRYPQVPWKEMAGMRDKLIHEYYGIDHDILWETIRHSIPRLKKDFSEVVTAYHLRKEP